MRGLAMGSLLRDVDGGVPIDVEKEKWRILPVDEVDDQPAALAGGESAVEDVEDHQHD